MLIISFLSSADFFMCFESLLMNDFILCFANLLDDFSESPTGNGVCRTESNEARANLCFQTRSLMLFLVMIRSTFVFCRVG
jgi:hypothetical protein